MAGRMDREVNGRGLEAAEQKEKKRGGVSSPPPFFLYQASSSLAVRKTGDAMSVSSVARHTPA